MNRRQAISYINEHRAALGHDPLPTNMSACEVDKHLALIDEHAPYGNDPWGIVDSLY